MKDISALKKLCHETAKSKNWKFISYDQKTYMVSFRKFDTRLNIFLTTSTVVIARKGQPQESKKNLPINDLIGVFGKSYSSGPGRVSSDPGLLKSTLEKLIDEKNLKVVGGSLLNQDEVEIVQELIDKLKGPEQHV